MKFYVITATDNKPIENTMMKATTSDREMTGITDAKGFVNLGPFSDGEVGTVEIQGYNNLVKEFIFSSIADYMALEMTPKVLSKIL